MPGVILSLAVAILVFAGIRIRESSTAISNAAFLLAAVLAVLAALAFTRLI